MRSSVGPVLSVKKRSFDYRRNSIKARASGRRLLVLTWSIIILLRGLCRFYTPIIRAKYLPPETTNPQAPPDNAEFFSFPHGNAESLSNLKSQISNSPPTYYLIKIRVHRWPNLLKPLSINHLSSFLLPLPFPKEFPGNDR
jgi:hypothetical protein